MKLTQKQVELYKEQGFLFIPEYFSSEEVAIIRKQIPDVIENDAVGKVLEKDNKTLRVVYGSHLINDFFHSLVRHPRILEPARQLLASDVCILRSKITLKPAFYGDSWPWHQDFPFAHHFDGLPEAKIVNVMIFLGEVNEFNSPLYIIPGSNQEGIVSVEAPDPATEANVHQDWQSNFGTKYKYIIPQETITRLVEKGGIVSNKGPAGSVIFFDHYVVHGSLPNISPFDRPVFVITYNDVENKPISTGKEPRPEIVAGRDYTPLQPLEHADRLLFY